MTLENGSEMKFHTSIPLLYPQMNVRDILDSVQSRHHHRIISTHPDDYFPASLCGIRVHVCVCLNNYSKTIRPRDMLFLKIPYLSRMKIVQGMQICLSVCLLEPLQGRYPHQKCENLHFHFITIINFTIFSLTIAGISLISYICVLGHK